MADLEAAAEAALAKVKRLEEQSGQTEEALSALEARLTTVAGRVESDWTSMGEGLRSFAQHVQEEKDRLADQGEQLAGGLEELAQALASAQPAAEDDLRGSWNEVSALANEVEADRPRLEKMAEDIAASTQRLAEAAQSVQSQLEEALAAARDFLGVTLVEDMRGLQAQVRERAQELQRSLAEECQAALGQKYDNWLTTLNEVEELVDQAFLKAHEHVAQVVEYSLHECGARHEEAASELAQMVGTLEGVAGGLQQAIAQEAAELNQARTDLAHAVPDSAARIQAMTEALLGVRELMARFSFVAS
jgi:hypothetical protein